MSESEADSTPEQIKDEQIAEPGAARIVDLLRDANTLRRLRRVHDAFGDALREEQLSRELDSLDTQER